MIARPLLVPLAIALTAVLLVLLLRSPLDAVEDRVTALKYALRGEQRADTNIVLVYLDNDAIKALGFPVRRNFYALMVKTLNELGVRTIGIDVLFEDVNVEYPEYDDLLAGVIASDTNVVLSSYFRSLELDRVRPDAAAVGLDKFRFPQVAEVAQRGEELHLPLPLILRGAAGIGHSNIVGTADIPVFVAYENAVVPALGVEVLRSFLRAEREAVKYDGTSVTIAGRAGAVRFPTPADGAVHLLYPGTISSFTAYPFLEVLKSYDAVRRGSLASVPIQRLKDKLVLVGIIAGGRSETRMFATPVDPRFPSLGLHAVFLDNALRSGFLRVMPGWLVALVALLLGAGVGLSLVFLPSPPDKLAGACLLVAFTLVSYSAFALSSYMIPVVPGLIVGVICHVGGLLYKHRHVRQQLSSLEKEKVEISALLKDREAKVALLERELLDFETRKSADRTKELLEEIQRYKSEIRLLSSRANDMEEADVREEQKTAEVRDFEGIMYEKSGKMKPVVGFIGKIATSDAPVLILGESGTGKELVARAIHNLSGRAGKSFVAVNCGALAESLLESELFGHEKGAFTGAFKDKMGRFELADGGTIFLDEIGEVSEGFQLKLLRVLQEGEFERVGSSKTAKVDVRVVAATNKDLKERLKAKQFREDLYYRLSVLIVELPPLREREEDLPLLVQHFLRREDSGMKLSRNVMATLRNYQWPGNIRQLESVVKRAVLLAKAEKRSMIGLKDIPEDISSAVEKSVALEERIIASLRERGFSRSAITETADELGGLNRGTVAEYLRGQCLKAFVEHSYDREKAAQFVSLSLDTAVNDRVRKKLDEYLSNLAVAVDKSQTWDVAKEGLRPKTKNLPQRYHAYLEQVAEAYFRGVWKEG